MCLIKRTFIYATYKINCINFRDENINYEKERITYLISNSQYFLKMLLKYQNLLIFRVNLKFTLSVFIFSLISIFQFAF